MVSSEVMGLIGGYESGDRGLNIGFLGILMGYGF